MDWNRVHVWTRTFYAIVHSLHMAKEEKFGDLNSLDERFRDANNWVSPICSYNSTLLPTKTEGKELEFRRDPNAHFEEISSQLIKMLLQDLTVIFDEMMSDALIKLNLEAGNMPQSKVEKLSTLLNAEYKWANQGCLELIAIRNSLCHANGRWNEKSLKIIEGFVEPLPAVGDEIIVGFEMLFNYRKAMRTLLNEACPPDPKPMTIKKKSKAVRSKRSEARSLKE
ncbi:hypothetical protein HBO12_15115 [Pseudomonas sp. WS 5059]|uniref:hypothetical protein n=1 Tax=Pseudomonas sp. WS 5059 TaxID=2717491 RepID=UPI001474225E|nr:hypothetical protein [Pseudomonas sp. WS 5059]NMY04292.1 hypothetical protein [Pseudomonas sp. WS 5059]